MQNDAIPTDDLRSSSWDLWWGKSPSRQPVLNQSLTISNVRFDPPEQDHQIIKNAIHLIGWLIRNEKELNLFPLVFRPLRWSIGKLIKFLIWIFWKVIKKWLNSNPILLFPHRVPLQTGKAYWTPPRLLSQEFILITIVNLYRFIKIDHLKLGFWNFDSECTWVHLPMERQLICSKVNC